ncbi:uncharacterized protein [Epargyreus clarus]|uniref:uncharacterized protein n=1 Tax=Epargyreus clarus TaxID=520877 RepID=UPI003C2F9F1C
MKNLKMNKLLTKLFLVFLIVAVLSVDARKTSRGRSSGSGSRGSSRRGGSNPQPVPTSFSSPQASAPKPSLFGWQERPAQKTYTSSSRQSKPTNTHSYPSSNTGLSGNQPKQPPAHQENVQRSHASNNMASNSHSYPSSNTGLSGNTQPKQPSVHEESIQRNSGPLNAQQGAQSSNHMSHSYPASNSLSGNAGKGAGYPQGSGLSGSNAAPPPYQAGNSLNTQHANTGANYPTNNMGTNYNHGPPPPPYSNTGNNYHHPQGQPPAYTSVGNSYHHPPPPPPYSNYGPNYGGIGGHSPFNSGYGSQMPGYFGNYGGGRGFGGVSRTSSALTGVGIAGAGVGTILTGLALWNLARSTGRHHHTVIYDNRGQPVAVAPDNNSTATAMDSVLGDLINCTLTISNGNVTEILAIPCAIATSFTPEADVKDVNGNKNEDDKTKCTITVVTKAEREFMTTIPCSILLNTAAQNNVTEPPLLTNSTDLDVNATMASSDNILQPNQPLASKLSSGESYQNINNTESQFNCTLKLGEIPDPLNPCIPLTHDVSVIPLQSTEAAIVKR